MIGFMTSCLLDAYGTIIDADFAVRRRAQAGLAGLTEEAWHAAYLRLDPLLSIGHLSRTEAYELILRTCGVKPREGQLRELVELDRELTLAGGFVYPDTMPFLERLRERGITAAIVSNCGEFTRDLLISLGVAAYVDALVLSCEVGTIKPAPRIYRHALTRLGVAAQDALFVDDQALFCTGAEALGISAVRIVRHGELPAGAVRSLAEVDALL
jgi:putative hydrolase of the HAD superfamily